MKKTPCARSAKVIAAGALTASLLAMTGCSQPAPSGTPATVADSSPSASAAATQKAADSLRGTLVSIISGDTVELLPVSDKNGQPTGDPKVTVHILGIKAPGPGECGAPESASELKRIAQADGFFRVKYDPQSARVDSKGNVQGYLYSGDGSGVPFDLGYAMVHNGYAAAWYDRNDRVPKRYSEYSELTKAPQARKYGIWASCPPIAG